MSANEFRFVGQVMYKPEKRMTGTGKAVCTLKACQHQKAPKTEEGYRARWLTVDLWERDAETAAELNVGVWVEITGELNCGEKELYDPVAKKRTKVRDAISVQLPNVRVLEDAAEIAEALEELVLIQAREPRNERQAPKAALQRPRPGARAPEPPAYDDDPNADVPF